MPTDGADSCGTASRTFLDQLGLSCARVEKGSLDEILNAARQVRDKIYKNSLSGQDHLLSNRLLCIKAQNSKLEA